MRTAAPGAVPEFAQAARDPVEPAGFPRSFGGHAVRCGILGALVVLSASCAEETSAGCPLSTPQDWQSFLTEHASDPRWSATCEDGGCDPDFARELDGVMKRCDDLIANSPAIAACTANLRSFLPNWLRQHDTVSYGFSIDNQAYFAAEEGPGVPPGMMQPPQAILTAIPDLRAVEAAASARGIAWIVQSSCLNDGRIFFLVPDAGDAFDDWILLNLRGTPPNLTVNPEETMSFLAVQKKDAQGGALARVRVHFRDYTLAPAPGGGGGYTATPADSPTKCYSCHPSGVRQLIARGTAYLDAAPVRGEGAPDPDFARQRLNMFGDRLRSYGLPDWNATIDVTQLGPPIGAEQGCTRCHDGAYRGLLTVMTSVDQIREKVQYELSMPPAPDLGLLLERSELHNPPLTPAEQKALDAAFDAHQLLADAVLGGRGPALSRWLLMTPCQ